MDPETEAREFRDAIGTVEGLDPLLPAHCRFLIKAAQRLMERQSPAAAAPSAVANPFEVFVASSHPLLLPNTQWMSGRDPSCSVPGGGNEGKAEADGFSK